MNIQYDGRSVTMDEQLRRQIEERVGRLEGLLAEPIEVRVALETTKHRHVADLHVTHPGGSLKATEASDRLLLDAVQAAVEKLERQARRARGRRRDLRRRPRRAPGAAAAESWPLSVVDRASLSDGGGRRVIKSSQLQIKPMTIEEAALYLDGSKNDFVVFRDADTDSVSVLYKRRDDHYGLIAPES